MLRDAAWQRVTEAGPLTPAGGRALLVWQSASDRVERLVKLLGLTRVPKATPTPTLAEWLARRDADVSEMSASDVLPGGNTSDVSEAPRAEVLPSTVVGNAPAGEAGLESDPVAWSPTVPQEALPLEAASVVGRLPCVLETAPWPEPVPTVARASPRGMRIRSSARPGVSTRRPNGGGGGGCVPGATPEGGLMLPPWLCAVWTRRPSNLEIAGVDAPEALVFPPAGTGVRRNLMLDALWKRTTTTHDPPTQAARFTDRHVAERDRLRADLRATVAALTRAQAQWTAREAEASPAAHAERTRLAPRSRR